jgi:predicted nucleic acid-binding protein
MITLDTSGLLALVRERDQFHSVAIKTAHEAGRPLIVPVGIMAEITYMLEQRSDARYLDTFLQDIENGLYQLDCGTTDVPRIRQLVSRYRSMPLGFADAAVVACAERRGGRVLTYDQRHFPVVAREGTIQIVGHE